MLVYRINSRLCYAILCCIVSRSSMLCSTVLYYIVFCDICLYCIMLHHSIIHYIISYHAEYHICNTFLSCHTINLHFYRIISTVTPLSPQEGRGDSLYRVLVGETASSGVGILEDIGRRRLSGGYLAHLVPSEWVVSFSFFELGGQKLGQLQKWS